MAQNVFPIPAFHLARPRMHEAATRQGVKLTTEEWSHLQGCRPCLETFAEVIRQQTPDTVGPTRIIHRDPQTIAKRGFDRR